MKQNSADDAMDPSDEIEALVRTLHETQLRLRELTGGQVDAVLHSDGQSYLLLEAQENLRTSERSQRSLATTQVSILNALPAHVALLDSQGVIVAVNDKWRRFAELNGLQSSECCVGNNYVETCERAQGDCANEAQQAAAEIRKVLTGVRKKFSLEYPCHSLTEQRWFQLMVTPLDGAAPSGAVVMHIDITERKLAENALHLQTERLSVATRSAGIGIWDWDIQLDTLTWDDRMYALYGITRSDFTDAKQAWLNCLHPDDCDKTNTMLMRAVRGDGDYDTEFRIVKRDGSLHTIKANGHVLRDLDGQPLRMIGVNYDITDRKEAEYALQASLDEFHGLAESMPQIVWIAQPDGKGTYANQNWIDYTGLSLEESLDDGWIKPFHPEDKLRAWETWQTATTNRGQHSMECRLRRADDTYRWFLIRGRPQLDAQGNIVKWFGTSTDIHDLKMAEQAQRMSEERFSHAFEYAPNGMVILATDGKVVTVNRKMCDLTGYSLQEYLQKTFGEVTHPDDVPRELAYINKMLAGEILFFQMEKRYLHKDGHEIPVHITSSLVRDANDKPLYFIKQVQDVTNIKKAYQQIEEQAALIDEASDAIHSHDTELRITFWSKGAERLYGYSADEAKGRNVKELLKVDFTKFAEADQATRQAGQWNGEVQKTNKAGVSLTINSRWTLLKDAEGRPRSVLAIDSDVTERRKLEQQFLRAQRMESIGTLAGGIAHDLNNILAPIMMSIDVLKSISDKPEAMEILETIRISAKRGADIVRQVLSFARGVESKRIEVQPKHILEDVENIVKNTFPKSVQVTTTIPRDTWTILGDPTQIHQIILNLCVNARDAMPNGGKLELAVGNFMLDDQFSVMSNEAKPGPYVQISVTDSGTGIRPELLERIFEPFFTTKEVSKGTGLGLSTVMAIVKSHEGTINVYSEPGKGTTFKVFLPALESSPEKRKAQTQRVSLPRGNGETILVVDDEASILTITAQTLLAFGYRVLKAGDGAEAVALYARNEQEIAVVLTDMMMPVLDGTALVHALKRMNPAVKIIAASGLNAEANAKLTEAGVNHFLTKPYTAGTLLKSLQEILSEK